MSFRQGRRVSAGLVVAIASAAAAVAAASGGQSVRASATKPRPDLVVTAVSASPGFVRPGGVVTIGGVPGSGVDGTGGRSAKEFRRYLGRREVACEPVGNAEVYQCRAGDQDLSRVVLFNGGGRASANASAELRRMEELARSMHTGIWGGRDDDDDD